MLITGDYSELSSAFDWLKEISLRNDQSEVRSQILVVSLHLYGILRMRSFLGRHFEGEIAKVGYGLREMGFGSS